MGAPPVILCPEARWYLNRYYYCIEQYELNKLIGLNRAAQNWLKLAGRYMRGAEFAERSRII